MQGNTQETATVSYAHVYPYARKAGTTEPAFWAYKLHPLHTKGGYTTRLAAKAAMMRHLRRGGLKPEWYRRLGLTVPQEAYER